MDYPNAIEIAIKMMAKICSTRNNESEKQKARDFLDRSGLSALITSGMECKSRKRLRKKN